MKTNSDGNNSTESTGNKRLDSEGERKRNQCGGRNAEIASILGGNRQTGSGCLPGTRTSKSEQESALREYAEQNNFWFSERQIIDRSSRKLPSGKEADVYIDKSGRNVIKVIIYAKYSNTPADFLNNRILLYNHLFKGTPYNIIGFTQTNRGFSFVVEQPFIKGSLLLSFATSESELDNFQGKVEDYMKNRFNMNTAGLDAFENELHSIQDVHLKNVIQGVDNNLYFIDVIPSYKNSLSK